MTCISYSIQRVDDECLYRLSLTIAQYDDYQTDIRTHHGILIDDSTCALYQSIDHINASPWF